MRPATIRIVLFVRFGLPRGQRGPRFGEALAQLSLRPWPDRRFGGPRTFARRSLIRGVGNRRRDERGQLRRHDAVLHLQQFPGTWTVPEVKLVIHPMTEEQFLVTGQVHERVFVRHRAILWGPRATPG